MVTSLLVVVVCFSTFHSICRGGDGINSHLEENSDIPATADVQHNNNNNNNYNNDNINNNYENNVDGDNLNDYNNNYFVEDYEDHPQTQLSAPEYNSFYQDTTDEDDFLWDGKSI